MCGIFVLFVVVKGESYLKVTCIVVAVAVVEKIFWKFKFNESKGTIELSFHNWILN